MSEARGESLSCVTAAEAGAESEPITQPSDEYWFILTDNRGITTALVERFTIGLAGTATFVDHKEGEKPAYTEIDENKIYKLRLISPASEDPMGEHVLWSFLNYLQLDETISTVYWPEVGTQDSEAA